MKQRLLILATDFAGTVDDFDSTQAKKFLDLKGEIENKLKVKFVWTLISGTSEYSMECYTTNFNEIISSVSENDEILVELGFSENGGDVFSQTYTSQDLQALSLDFSKGECIKNVIAFYESLGYKIYTLLYAGDGNNDYSAFRVVKALPNYLSSPRCFAPLNATLAIKDLADIVSLEHTNISGVMDCLKKWLKTVE